MNTSKEEMKHLLAGLQALQRTDAFAHRIDVETRVCDDGDLVVQGSFSSLVDRDEDGTAKYYYVYLYSSNPLRQNNAEYNKFKELLLGDK